jgi:predicted Zn finger-like uncharacterized protein
MFTVCPKCTLTLVVTTVDLRAGQGYVRCGRCANVFNALIALREGDPNGNVADSANRRLQETAPAEVTPAVGAGVAMDIEPEPEPEAEPELEPEPEPELEAQPEELPEEISLEFDASATDVSDIFISPEEVEHDTASGNYETVVLGDDPAHGDTIAAEDWSLLDDEPVADAESVIEESPFVADEPTTQPDPPWVEEMFAEAEAVAERIRPAEDEDAFAEPAPVEEPESESEPEPEVVDNARASAGGAAPADTALEPLFREPVEQRPSWQYLSGIGALVLALVLQVLHFNRQSLVLNESVGPAVSAVYGWFGVALVPRWDLSAYSVKQLGADAEGGEGTKLRVRLSLQNDSSRVQPLPLLRLTLQDRYGNAVATRDLEPRDYLPARAANDRLLEPDQRIDAELHVIDPGKAAIGFEIDACLRGESGAIGCANDARRRSAG